MNEASTWITESSRFDLVGNWFRDREAEVGRLYVKAEHLAYGGLLGEQKTPADVLAALQGVRRDAAYLTLLAEAEYGKRKDAWPATVEAKALQSSIPGLLDGMAAQTKAISKLAAEVGQRVAKAEATAGGPVE